MLQPEGAAVDTWIGSGASPYLLLSICVRRMGVGGCDDWIRRFSSSFFALSSRRWCRTSSSSTSPAALVATNLPPVISAAMIHEDQTRLPRVGWTDPQRLPRVGRMDRPHRARLDPPPPPDQSTSCLEGR